MTMRMYMLKAYSEMFSGCANESYMGIMKAANKLTRAQASLLNSAGMPCLLM